MDTSITPKPDPIVLDPVPMAQPTTTSQITSTDPIVSSGPNRMDKIKAWMRKNKKLTIALIIFFIALLIAIVILLLNAAQANRNDVVTPPISAPEEIIKTVILSKECKAENQDITVKVPSDWTCSKNNNEISTIKDLRLDNSEMYIVFPKDVQPNLGCVQNDTDCTSDVIYQSSKVEFVTIHRNKGKIFVIRANVKIDSKNFAVDIKLKNPNLTEITKNQENLIIKILESITLTSTPVATTQTIDYVVDSGFQISGQAYNSLEGSLVTDPEVTLSNDAYNQITLKKGNSAFTIYSFHEEFEHEFDETVFIGPTKSLGNVYRIKQRNQSTGAVEYYYAQPDTLTLSGSCLPVSFGISLTAPCGTLNYKGFFFQCTGDQNLDFCDDTMIELDFTVVQKTY